MVDNRSAVALSTRRLLRDWMAQAILDEESLRLVEQVLEGSRPGSSAVWVHDLARMLGASAQEALRASTCAELLYTAIDFTDDVEDGDAPARLPDVAPAVCINAAAHLFVLGWRATCEWDGALGARIAALASGMFCGQRVELTRDGWNIDTYERMATATGGLQLEIYARLAAHAAGRSPAPLVPPCGPLGVLLHVETDRRSEDPRLLCLAKDAASALEARYRTALESALAALDGPVRLHYEQMLRTNHAAR